MRYRLGILSGLVIMGIIALGLATGITDSGTVEAARPSVTVTRPELVVAPAVTEGECSFAHKVGWEGSAYAHKNGHYTIFLWAKNDLGDDVLVKFKKDTIAKGKLRGTIESLPLLPHIGSTGTVYRSRIVFFTSKGQGGWQMGRELVRDQQFPKLVC